MSSWTRKALWSNSMATADGTASSVSPPKAEQAARQRLGRIALPPRRGSRRPDRRARPRPRRRGGNGRRLGGHGPVAGQVGLDVGVGHNSARRRRKRYLATPLEPRWRGLPVVGTGCDSLRHGRPTTGPAGWSWGLAVSRLAGSNRRPPRTEWPPVMGHQVGGARRRSSRRPGPRGCGARRCFRRTVGFDRAERRLLRPPGGRGRRRRRPPVRAPGSNRHKGQSAARPRPASAGRRRRLGGRQQGKGRPTGWGSDVNRVNVNRRSTTVAAVSSPSCPISATDAHGGGRLGSCPGLGPRLVDAARTRRSHR